MKDTYLNKAITIFTAFLALSLCLLFTDAHASASEVDPSQATWVDPQVLRGEKSSPLTSYGYEVFYSQQNASTFSANNIQTQCISSHIHTTWYGLSARQCKAADATGASFTIFNAATGRAVAKVDLKKVPLPPIGKSVPLGCVAYRNQSYCFRLLVQVLKTGMCRSVHSIEVPGSGASPPRGSSVSAWAGGVVSSGMAKR